MTESPPPITEAPKPKPKCPVYPDDYFMVGGCGPVGNAICWIVWCLFVVAWAGVIALAFLNEGVTK